MAGSLSWLPTLTLAVGEAAWPHGQLTGLQILAFLPTCSVALELSYSLGHSVCDLGGCPWASVW